MIKKIRKLAKDESGQSLIELCMMLPFILLIVFCAISVGLLVYTQMLVTFASNQAVDRAAEVMGNADMTYAQKVQEIEEVAFAYLSNGISGGDKDVDIQMDGEMIKVKVTYKFRLLFPFTDEVFGNKTTIPLEAESIDYVD